MNRIYMCIDLKSFYASVECRERNLDPLKTNFKLEDIDFNELRTEAKLRILTSISDLDFHLFKVYFEGSIKQILGEINLQRTGLNNFLLLYNIVNYLEFSGTSYDIELNLRSLSKKLDLRGNMHNLFNGFNDCSGITVTEDDMDKLISYNDDLLREKVANIINGVSKLELNREMRKPHGPAEIADMELSIKLNDDNAYLCMPFKSGREISGKSVPENIAYQILRPFVDLDNAVVVFISAKPCSEYLINYLKRAKNKFGWEIELLTNIELAKILKYNGQLN